jgi:hypothetical protein
VTLLYPLAALLFELLRSVAAELRYMAHWCTGNFSCVHYPYSNL